MNWYNIDCKDPENFQKVIVVTENKKVFVCRFIKKTLVNIETLKKETIGRFYGLSGNEKDWENEIVKWWAPVPWEEKDD